MPNSREKAASNAAATGQLAGDAIAHPNHVLGGPIKAKLIIERRDAVADVARNAQLGFDLREDIRREVPESSLEITQNGEQRFAGTGRSPFAASQDCLKDFLGIHRTTSKAPTLLISVAVNNLGLSVRLPLRSSYGEPASHATVVPDEIDRKAG